MSLGFHLSSYLSYLARSFHLHGIHSPFVYRLQKELIEDKNSYYCYDEIEGIRAKLLLTNKKIDLVDLGAGSKKDTSQKRSISSIAKHASQKKELAQLIHKIVKERQPQVILELGTSFGLTTAYMAKAAPSSKIYTIEGANQIAQIAQINWEKLNIKNIKLFNGNIDDYLPQLVQENETLDLVYFDGNHREAATINYFEQCLSRKNEESVFIFDDIYWSKGMKSAWQQIKAHPEVRITVDLYRMGLVFFKRDQEKENFTIYQ